MRFCLTTFALLLGTLPALAHRLEVDPRIKDDKLHVEAFYDDNSPAQQAKITVFNGDKIVAEGCTDEKGIWECVKPGPGTYLVKAESLGHAAKETVFVPDEKMVASASIPKRADDSESNQSDERAKKTETPWWQIFLGLGIIAFCCGLWFVARRTRTNTPGPNGTGLA
jgi:hypothetical protein